MKKSVIILLVIVLLTSGLGACSDLNEEKQEVQNTAAAGEIQPTQQPTMQITPWPAPEPTPLPAPPVTQEEISIKRDLLVWKMAYPDYINGFEMDEDGFIYAVMKSGNKILYDDRKQKTFEEKMNGADLQDALEMIYPLEDLTVLLEGDFDPGRVRPYALFDEVYGKSKKAVKANVVSVKLGNNPFNKHNGASKAIMKVFVELKKLCAQNKGFKDFIYPCGGTFSYRYIARTKNLSMHSYAVAIDLHFRKNRSWRSASREKGQERIAVFPPEIVRAFEDNNFIWGGKWAHFDIMHFEYRPEIIIKSRYNAQVGEGEQWYAGFPDDEQVISYVQMIDGIFNDAVHITG